MEDERMAAEARTSELAHQWQKVFETKKTELLSRPDATMDNVVDLYWQYYILARVAPEDPEVKAARQSKRKDVWPGTRDDAEVYERFLYSILYAKDSLGRNYTSIGAGYAAGAVSDSLRIVYTKFLKDLPKAKYRDEPDILFFVDKFVEKAKKALELHGGDASKLLTIGAKGEIDGIPVTVDAITDKGEVWLKANSAAEHVKLLDAIHKRHPKSHGGMLASSLDLETFVNPEFPDTYSMHVDFAWSRRTNHEVDRSIVRDLAEHNIPDHLVDLQPIRDKLFFGKAEGEAVKANIIFTKEDGIRCEVVD